jgi:hypothetical protein
MTTIRKAIPKIAICGTNQTSNVTIALGLASRLSKDITVVESSKFYESSSLADRVKFEPVYIDEPTYLNFDKALSGVKNLAVVNSMSDAWLNARAKMEGKPIHAWKTVKGSIDNIYTKLQAIPQTLVFTYRTSPSTDIKNPNAPAKYNPVAENKGLVKFAPRFSVIVEEKDNTGKYYITKNLHDPSTVGSEYNPETLAEKLK